MTETDHVRVNTRMGEVCVVVQSEVFGTDVFHYDTVDEALEGIRKLYVDVLELNDGVERVIGILVNEEIPPDLSDF